MRTKSFICFKVRSSSLCNIQWDHKHRQITKRQRSDESTMYGYLTLSSSADLLSFSLAALGSLPLGGTVLTRSPWAWLGALASLSLGAPLGRSGAATPVIWQSLSSAAADEEGHWENSRGGEKPPPQPLSGTRCESSLGGEKWTGARGAEAGTWEGCVNGEVAAAWGGAAGAR